MLLNSIRFGRIFALCIARRKI